MKKLTDREVEILEEALALEQVEQIPPEFYESYASDGIYLNDN